MIIIAKCRSAVKGKRFGLFHFPPLLLLLPSPSRNINNDNNKHRKNPQVTYKRNAGDVFL